MSNNNEFENFVKSHSNDSPSENAPKELSQYILNIVKSDINPSPTITFSKIFSIQLVVGILTTLICPQFQLSFVDNQHLFHYFHANFGEFGCMSICGAIFVGSGAFVSCGLLSIAELKLIHKKNIIFYFTFNLVLLFSFYLLGANLNPSPALFWIIGAMAAGLVLFETGRYLKYKIKAIASQ